jgi:hypothetical protein
VRGERRDVDLLRCRERFERGWKPVLFRGAHVTVDREQWDNAQFRNWYFNFGQFLTHMNKENVAVQIPWNKGKKGLQVGNVKENSIFKATDGKQFSLKGQTSRRIR